MLRTRLEISVHVANGTNLADKQNVVGGGCGGRPRELEGIMWTSVHGNTNTPKHRVHDRPWPVRPGSINDVIGSIIHLEVGPGTHSPSKVSTVYPR